MNGTIKSYLPEKSYGFINGDDGKDYFFHTSDFLSGTDKCILAEGRYVSFEQHATPKGYKARNIALIDSHIEIKYSTPDKIMTSKYEEVKGWEIVDSSRWIVHGSCRNSPDSAKDNLLAGARKIGANGLLFMRYYKTTGSEAGTGKGTHYFTIHNYQGQAVMLAKKNMSGHCTLDDLKGLDVRAKSLKHRLVSKTNLHRRCLWGFLTGVVVALAIFHPNKNLWIMLGVGSLIVGTFLSFRINYHSWLQEG